MRDRLAARQPDESAAYARLRAAGLSDRQAINRLVTVLEHAWDRAVDAWEPFNEEAYVADLEVLR